MKCFVIYFAFQHFVIRPLHSVELAAILFFSKRYTSMTLPYLTISYGSHQYYIFCEKKNVVLKKNEDFTWRNLKLIKFEVWEFHKLA